MSTKHKPSHTSHQPSIHPDDWKRMKEQFGMVEIASYAGDWNLGAGSYWIGFSGTPECGQMVIAHVYSDNNPFDHSPPAMEAMWIELDGRQGLETMRDWLNGVLAEPGAEGGGE